MKNFFSASAWRVAAFSVFFLPISALSQALDCERVLDNSLINTKSTDRSETLIANIQNNLCNDAFTNRGQAQDKLRSGGWDLEVFDYFNNSLKDNKRVSTGSYDISRTEFCTSTSQQLARSLGSNYLERNGRFVLDAYAKCAEIANKNVLYLEYNMIPLGDIEILEGTLHRRVSSGELTYSIKGLSVTPKNSNISCRIGSRPVPQKQSEPQEWLKIEASTAIVSCEKPAASPAYISIDTTAGGFSIHALPQDEAAEAAELEQLSTELKEAYERVAQLENDNSTLNSSLISANSRSQLLEEEQHDADKSFTCARQRMNEIKPILELTWLEWQAMAAYMPGSSQQAQLVMDWMDKPALSAPFSHMQTTRPKIYGKLDEVTASLNGQPNC